MMNWIKRALASELQKAVRSLPAVLLTGPRQCGKTTLLKQLFPRAEHVLLEDPDVISRVRSDPRGFLDELRLPVILDEIQNAPELFAYVRSRIDASPRRNGQWLLTGSQEAPLMRGVTESMAGRVAVLHLLPLSTRESVHVNLLRGGYPEVITHPRKARLWMRSYVQTYLERDVRSVVGVKDLGVYRRFLSLFASRMGGILNKTDLAAPLGVSVPTIAQWIDALEVTGQVLRVPPYYENFGKRLVKSSKYYFVDNGLFCHLLSIDSLLQLRRSPFSGVVFESFVASEIVKQQVNRGERPELYFFRDEQGLEVDFIVPKGPRRLALIEAKFSSTPIPAMAKPILRLRSALGNNSAQAFLVHEGRLKTTGRSVAPQVSAVSVPELLQALDD